MNVASINREEIVLRTQEYGSDWGICHTQRLLKLIAMIGAGMDYDEEIVWIAAHLHDWGAYKPWIQPGVEHYERSREVAEQFLKEIAYPEERMARVLEAIATHHSGDPNRGIEAVLLSDADAVDFLGTIGMARNFSRMFKDLRSATNTIRSQRAKLPANLCLPKSKELAQARLEEMDAFLDAFEKESFGLF